MISEKQNRFYWGLWKQAKAILICGRETWTCEEENKRRHELHVRAIGRDKSHYDLTNFEFDRVVSEFRAVIDPSDLRVQLRQADQPTIRMRFGVRSVMRELGVDEAYVAGIIHRMNEHGQLASNRLANLGVDDLRKVLIALRKHARRGGGTVSPATTVPAARRQYILQPA